MADKEEIKRGIERMVWPIRLVASLYVVTNALNMLGQWWYANVPTKHGGSRLNPFNDPTLIPHMYNNNNNGKAPPPLDGHTTRASSASVQWPWIAWMLLNMCAAICFAYDRWGDTGNGGLGLVAGAILTVAVYVLKPPLT